MESWGMEGMDGQPVTGKNFFSISNPNFFSFNLKLFTLVLPLQALIQSPSPAILEPLYILEWALRSPQSLLQDEQSQFSQFFPKGEVLHPFAHWVASSVLAPTAPHPPHAGSPRAAGSFTFSILFSWGRLSANYPISSDVPCEFLRTARKGKLKLTRCYAGLSGGAVSFLQSTLCANPW